MDLGICPTTSRPDVSQSNLIVERAIIHVEEGARAVLLHAGLPPRLWPLAATFFCVACNIDEAQGPSPWDRRRGHGSFKGVRCPFRALIDFLPPKPLLAKQPKFLGLAVSPGFS